MSGFEQHFERRRSLFRRYLDEAAIESSFSIADDGTHAQVETRLPLREGAFAAISEVLRLDRRGRPIVDAYAYWLVAEGVSNLAYDFAPDHEPASHRHPDGGDVREPCAPMRLEDVLRLFAKRLTERP